jgi:hypothetical protein
MPIIDITKSAYNYETSRVEQLIPRELRTEATNFIELLKEYYRFMNAGEGSSGPSLEISRANEQHDLDLINEKYLEQMHAFLAPYVPNSNIIARRKLLKLIVKYFYNNRGSRESVDTFFRLFFNTTASIIENVDNSILYTEEITEQNSVYQNKLAKAWKPYAYGISTDISVEKWREAYKSLVHPIGWIFFAYLDVRLESLNFYSRIPSYYFDYNSNFLKDWFYLPPAGCHTPAAQAECSYYATYFIESFVSNQTSPIQDATVFHLGYTTIPEQDRMDLAKIDYVSNLKFNDYAEIAGYRTFTIENTEQEYPQLFSGDFINVSSIVVIDDDPNTSYDQNDTTPPVYENEDTQG